MMRRVLLACLFCFTLRTLPVLAATPTQQPGPPTPEQLAAGQALAERIRSGVPPESSEISGRFIIRANGTVKEIPFLCKVVLNATNWETDYDVSNTADTGAEQLVIVHTTNGANQYLYAKAPSPFAPLPKLEPIAPSKAEIPLAGSDFSLADFGLQFLHWPIQRQVKEETRLSRGCYVLESKNPQGGAIVRVRSDIDEEYFAPLIVNTYDADGREVKQFSLHGSSFTKINGRWQMKKMDIINKKTRSHTEVEFDIK